MISILTRDAAVQAFALKLLNEPFFQDGTLTLYSDVPVPALHYAHPYHVSAKNLCSDRERYRDVCIDLMVCRDNAVLLAICFDEGESQHELMFRAYLHGLDYLRHKLPALARTDLVDLYQQTTEKLHMFSSYQLTSDAYMLYPNAVTQDMALLHRKGFLKSEAMSLHYTRDCGLFFHCTLSDDTLVQIPVTSVPMRTIFTNAIHWQTEDLGFAPTLDFILNIPLTKLFQTRPDLLDFLKKCLSVAPKRLGLPEDFYVFTYEDCLRLLQKIKEHSSESRDDLAHWHSSILYALAEIMSNGIPFFQLTLQEYFHAAAVLTGCYYPIWLYERHYRSHLCGKPEEEFTVTDYISACQHHIIFSEHSTAACRSLHNLLLAPISVPNAQ